MSSFSIPFFSDWPFKSLSFTLFHYKKKIHRFLFIFNINKNWCGTKGPPYLDKNEPLHLFLPKYYFGHIVQHKKRMETTTEIYIKRSMKTDWNVFPFSCVCVYLSLYSDLIWNHQIINKNQSEYERITLINVRYSEKYSFPRRLASMRHEKRKQIAWFMYTYNQIEWFTI